jgi:hypothetical protein
MLNRKQILIAGSMSAVFTMAAWSVENQGQSGQSNEGGNPNSSAGINREAIIKGWAEHEYAVRKQECDTLKHGSNANAVDECLRSADKVRTDMMNQVTQGGAQQSVAQNSGGEPGNATAQQLPSASGGNSGGAGTAGQHQGGNPSVVEKVKNTVKDTWSELTGDAQRTGQPSGTAGTQGSQEEGQKLAANGQGLTLQGAGGVALFCQPINNLQSPGTMTR